MRRDCIFAARERYNLFNKEAGNCSPWLAGTLNSIIGFMETFRDIPTASEKDGDDDEYLAMKEAYQAVRQRYAASLGEAAQNRERAESAERKLAVAKEALKKIDAYQNGNARDIASEALRTLTDSTEKETR